MSNYWRMHCKSRGHYSESDFNHGEEILRSMVKVFPHIKAAQDADESGYLEFNVMAHGSELFSFLREHEGHELDLADEYGRFEPIIEPTTNEESAS
jgi:hypothetical protein